MIMWINIRYKYLLGSVRIHKPQIAQRYVDLYILCGSKNSDYYFIYRRKCYLNSYSVLMLDKQISLTTGPLFEAQLSHRTYKVLIHILINKALSKNQWKWAGFVHKAFIGSGALQREKAVYRKSSRSRGRKE